MTNDEFHQQWLIKGSYRAYLGNSPNDDYRFLQESYVAEAMRFRLNALADGEHMVYSWLFDEPRAEWSIGKVAKISFYYDSDGGYGDRVDE